MTKPSPHRPGHNQGAKAPRPGRARTPTAPRGLSARARKLWGDVVSRWRMDPGALTLLEEAVRQLDQADAAAETVKAEGMTITNVRSGAMKPHPALAIRERSLHSFRLLWKELRLEIPEG